MTSSAYRCDPRKAATAVAELGPAWTARLDRVQPLPIHLCRDMFILTTHLDEDVCAAGGLMHELAVRGADIEVLAITEGDGTQPGCTGSTPTPTLRRRTRRDLAYRRLGVHDVRLHRLDLPSGEVDLRHLPELTTAISEFLGRGAYPGLWCLAPWEHDGHPDHEAVGRAAESVCAFYQVRLVRYLVSTWHWARPDDLPWPHLRRLVLPAAARDRKQAATGLRNDAPIAVNRCDQELFLL